MPKKLLVEFTCTRCPRTWYVPYDPEGGEPQAPSFTAVLTDPLMEQPNREVKFDCLCQRCAETVRNYIDNIGKSVAHKSPQSRARKKPPKAAPSRKGRKAG